MEQPFIYKYRPKTLSEFEIDDNDNNYNNISLCETFIKINNINLLIVGDSGTGKTTIINCVIKDYYGEYYREENIMSINSLKEQGINYYRNDVKTFCQTISVIPNKKKFIIIDDIDMLNEQSQQVFRNCIDKYNNNVNFILSCNNIQKVQESIQSRIFIIKLDIPSNIILEKIITRIATREDIIITDDSKKLIVTISNNSVKTLINYLEKFKLLNKIVTYDDVMDCCTNIRFETFIKFTTYCKNKELRLAIKLINSIYDNGYSVIDILDNYFLFIKITDIISETEKYKIIKLLCKYITIFYNIHEDEIELTLFTNNLIKIF